MNIIIDTREKEKAIKKITVEFQKQKITYDSSKLIVGDYMSLENPKRYIDRKQNLSELCNNLSYADGRFYRELRRAKNLGIQLVILCEHGGNIHSIEDIAGWKNPRLNPANPAYCKKAITGRELMERVYKVHISYGAEFVFCEKKDTGKRIVELLSDGY